LEMKRLLAAERTVSRSRTSKIATSNAAEMASRGTLPEGARSLREKKADGRAEWGRWARVYTRKLSMISNQFPGNDVLGRSRDLAAIPPLPAG
jgi:hypothetical protein